MFKDCAVISFIPLYVNFKGYFLKPLFIGVVRCTSFGLWLVVEFIFWAYLPIFYFIAVCLGFLGLKCFVFYLVAFFSYLGWGLVAFFFNLILGLLGLLQYLFLAVFWYLFSGIMVVFT